MASHGRVLVINTSVDVIEALEHVLRADGHDVSAHYVRDLRRGELTIEEMLEPDPDVVIFDIAPPYEENLSFFNNVFSRHPDVKGRSLILTTTNLKAANIPPEAVSVELVLKPFDLSVLLDRVREGVARRRQGRPH